MNQTKSCQNCKQQFDIASEDSTFYEKMKLPLPTFCRSCRFQQQLMFRNNRVFYKRTCGKCNNSVLSVFHESSPYTMFCSSCWWGDSWDPMSYGRDYDFSIPFFNQFRALQHSVPRPNLFQTNFKQSEYCNYGQNFNQCHLLFGGYDNERIWFGTQMTQSRESFDVAFSNKIEYGYELFECKRSNRLYYSHHTEDSMDSYYLIDCRNCSNCFGCVNLRKKQYCVFNEQYTKADYEKFIERQHLGSYAAHLETIKKLEALLIKQPRRYVRIWNSINTDGDDVSESKNTHHAFASSNAEDAKYIFYGVGGIKDSIDSCFVGYGGERLYQVAHSFGGSNTICGTRALFNDDASYIDECHNSKKLFGCIGLRKKEYCILNKQYSKEEYETLVPKIIAHMNTMPYVDQKGRIYKYGDFFPHELTPFAYNESIAGEYAPIDKEVALEQGFRWRDAEQRNYTITRKAEDLPDDINDIEDTITNDVVGCLHSGNCVEQCTSAFRIAPQELQFYRTMKLPLPRLCPNCRHYMRLRQRNPLNLWQRSCMCEGVKSEMGVYANTAPHSHINIHCANIFLTTYTSDRKEIVYCEQCYQQEVA